MNRIEQGDAWQCSRDPLAPYQRICRDREPVGVNQFTLDDFLGATGNSVHSPDPYPLRLPL